jgi:hypothetical protein
MSYRGISVFVCLALAIVGLCFRALRGSAAQHPGTQAAARGGQVLDGAVDEAFRSLAAEMGEPGVGRLN